MADTEELLEPTRNTASVNTGINIEPRECCLRDWLPDRQWPVSWSVNQLWRACETSHSHYLISRARMLQNTRCAKSIIIQILKIPI